VKEPVVIMYGDLGNKEHVPLRVHDQCFTSEVLGRYTLPSDRYLIGDKGSKKCDCKEQLDFSLEYIKEHSGLLLNSTLVLLSNCRSCNLPSTRRKRNRFE
jgi:GTP cyclohydrolase II